MSAHPGNPGRCPGRIINQLRAQCPTAPKVVPLVVGVSRDGATYTGCDCACHGEADVPPSPHGSVFGTDAVCMPPVFAGGMTCPDCDGRGYGVANVNKCGLCGGTGHVLRDHK